MFISRVLQCVSQCVVVCVAVWCSMLQIPEHYELIACRFSCDEVRVLQRLLQCVAVFPPQENLVVDKGLEEGYHGVLCEHVAVCCSVCCSLLQGAFHRRIWFSRKGWRKGIMAYFVTPNMARPARQT